MYIPTVYLLFAGEFLLLLLGVSLFLVLYIVKRRAQPVAEQQPEESDAATAGLSYLEYLEQQLQHNTARLTQADADNTDDAAGGDEESPADAADTPDDSHSKLLRARYMFLQAEKKAAAHSDDEQAFWDSMYASMKSLLKEFETVKQEQVVVHEESVEHKKETVEKVFYIEAQGKKVNDEINKLKDIIYDQENSINGLRKSLHHAEEHFPEDSEQLDALRGLVESFERQIRDSTMCMEVLELENDRLQNEVHQLEGRLKESAGSSSAGGDRSGAPRINLQEMKEVLDRQTLQIEELHQTIEGLQLDQEQSGKLKTTINSFARTSQEMMGCITILEEENEHLKEQLHDIEDHGNSETAAAGDAASEELHKQIKSLQEEIIKKDVNYAKLQDEFSSMEKEYLAMYEAMHGDNS